MTFMVTKGHRGRRLGRAISKLEASVELSAKERQAKKSEEKSKQKMKADSGYSEDYQVENLRDASSRRKSSA